MGVITSSRIGNAVVRSRARRLLREAFRLNQHAVHPPADLVIIATKYDGVTAAAETALKIAKPDAPILTIQNGLGSPELAASVLDQDKIAIEVVAFGPGIDLLRAESENRALVDSLITQGVRFDVCGNTLDTIEHETGQRPKINPHAIEVQVGVGQLLTLSEGGYTVIRP